MAGLGNIVQIIFLIFLLEFRLSDETFVKPETFLEARLAKGFWIPSSDILFANSLFEGGWIWTETGHLIITHVCRARTTDGHKIEPGELVNKTCFISGPPTLATLSGVQEFKEYEVLMKLDDEVYEWVAFDREHGHIPHGAVIGGIGTNYEPILICRKYYNGTAGDLKASKAVLGNFVPKDGMCYYEVEFGSHWVKWDLSFRTENFQLLILKVKTNIQLLIIRH